MWAGHHEYRQESWLAPSARGIHLWTYIGPMPWMATSDHRGTYLLWDHKWNAMKYLLVMCNKKQVSTPYCTFTWYVCTHPPFAPHDWTVKWWKTLRHVAQVKHHLPHCCHLLSLWYLSSYPSYPCLCASYDSWNCLPCPPSFSYWISSALLTSMLMTWESQAQVPINHGHKLRSKSFTWKTPSFTTNNMRDMD